VFTGKTTRAAAGNRTLPPQWLVALAAWGLWEFPSGKEEEESERRQKKASRRQRRELRRLLLEERQKEDDGHENDGLKRNVSGWWENLVQQSDKEQGETSKVVEDTGRDDNDDGGAISVLASVKTSVVAAVLGTGSSRESDDAEPEKKTAAADEEELPSFPSAEGLLASAQNAAAAAVSNVTENSDVSTTVEVEVEASETADEEWWQSARDAVLGKADEQAPVEPTLQEPAFVPTPEVPGLEDASLIVRVKIDPKEAMVEEGAEVVERLMAKSDRTVLEAMAQSGWEVETIDESQGLYVMSLPSVRYELPGGVVSIPAPRFLTSFRDLRGRLSGTSQARAEGDLVLQNGKDIFTIETGLPFKTKFKISAAGWTRASIDWDGERIVTANYVELGIEVPKVPGLTSLMEYFVRNYGNESTQQCANALANAARALPADADWFQSARDALLAAIPKSDEPSPVPVPDEADAEEKKKEEKEEEVKDDEDTAQVEEPAVETEISTVDADTEESTQGTEPEKIEDAPADAPPLEDESFDQPPEDVPGMDQANLVVRVGIDPKKVPTKTSGSEGVLRLMGRGDRTILETMSESGWEVEVVDESKGLYMMALPSVQYDVMGSSIAIPAPRFLCTFLDIRGRSSSAPFEERAMGTMVLQNGENIFTLELGFPFRTKLQLSASAWTRAKIGWEDDKVVCSNYVEVGVQVPKVPGLSGILEFFVKNYGNESTVECATTLAAGADKLPPESPLEVIEDKMKELFQTQQVETPSSKVE